VKAVARHFLQAAVVYLDGNIHASVQVETEADAEVQLRPETNNRRQRVFTVMPKTPS
jgi:hypothetical protein